MSHALVMMPREDDRTSETLAPLRRPTHTIISVLTEQEQGSPHTSDNTVKGMRQQIRLVTKKDMGDVRLAFSLGRCSTVRIKRNLWLPSTFVFQQGDCVLLSIASTFEYLFTGEYVSISEAVECLVWI